MAEKMTKKELKELRRMEKLEQATNPTASNNRMKWMAIGFVGVMFLSLFGYIIYSAKTERAKEAAAPKTFSASPWVRGNEKAENVVVEFADFQCPHCKQYEPFVAQAVKDLGSEVKFVFKYFPLSFKYTMLTARAAESAGMQGKFWEMHDLLFTNQEKIAQAVNGREVVVELAKSLKLDVAQFEKDLDSDAVGDRINTMKDEGINAGVTGTPTFFVNGHKIELAGSYEEFKKSIQENLKSPAVTPSVQPVQ